MVTERIFSMREVVAGTQIERKGKSEITKQVSDASELLGIFLSLHGDEADTGVEHLTAKDFSALHIFDEVKLHELQTKLQELQEDPGLLQEIIATADKDLVRAYVILLRIADTYREKVIHHSFEESVRDLPDNPELAASLSDRVIRLEGELSPEQKQMFQENFPSGNFFFHSTDVVSMPEILQMKELCSSVEVAVRKKEWWGQGGGEGISFNANNINVLRGTKGHFMGFFVSPESVLSDMTMLIVPEASAMNELRLVHRSYKRDENVHIKALGSVPPTWQPSIDIKLLPKIPIEQTYIFCSDRDREMIIKTLACHGIIPKGILTYPTHAIRSETWLDQEGDHEVANQLINNKWEECKIKPSLDWEKDLFPSPPTFYDIYVDDKSIDKSRVIILEDGVLKIQDYPSENRK